MNILQDSNYVFIDFEFNNSQEEVLNLVSCSYQVGASPVKNVWLLKDEIEQEALAHAFLKLRKTHTFVAYAAVAECRSFLALGLDPNTFKWIDLYFEHKQLTHTYHKFKYGRYFDKTGIMKTSVPPKFDKKQNKFADNNTIKGSYAAAVAVHFGEFIDSHHKDMMRDLILENKPVYSEQEQQNIMDYCASDIKWLPKLLDSMAKNLSSVLKKPVSTVLMFQRLRGDYAASLAKMESEGFPVVREAIENLRRNFPFAKEELIEDLCEVYPFYVREKTRKKDFRGSFKKKYELFEKFVKECPEINEKLWPVTDTGRYITDEKTLDKYEGIKEVKALKDTSKMITQLAWFQDPKKEDDIDIFKHIGSDDKLRGFLGGFGTQTGRNAPKAKTFILAMSSWLRCLIKPSKDEAIVAIDWAAQEFAIAAHLSRDKNMIAAYDSGDPYAWFAQKSKAIPMDAELKWVKNPFNAPEKLRDKYLEYKDARGLFKATVLGLQYGMGVESLAVKLTADCGRVVTEIEAQKLKNLHKQAFPVYWAWLEREALTYLRTGVLILKDGWSLLPNQDNGLSVRNLPTQGTGGVIMRRAVHLAHKKGIRIPAPLHDAVYAIYNKKTQADTPKILSECMQQAVEDVLGKGVVIRQDVDIHDSDHDWVEEKGKKFYELLGKYLERIENESDIDKKLDEGLFAPLKELEEVL